VYEVIIPPIAKELLGLPIATRPIIVPGTYPLCVELILTVRDLVPVLIVNVLVLINVSNPVPRFPCIP
jgi:hypothetical protein